MIQRIVEILRSLLLVTMLVTTWLTSWTLTTTLMTIITTTTTLTALWQDDDKIYLAHIGDSRAYRLRDGALEQMSRDHTLVNSLVEQGLITAAEARVHPKRNYIMKALGTNSSVEPDICCFERRRGDVWLLCSDGLSNYYDLDELRDILSGRRNWKAKAEALLRGALDRGGADNITLLIVVCDGGAL